MSRTKTITYAEKVHPYFFDAGENYFERTTPAKARRELNENGQVAFMPLKFVRVQGVAHVKPLFFTGSTAEEFDKAAKAAKAQFGEIGFYRLNTD